MSATSVVSVLNRQYSLTKSNFECLDDMCELNHRKGLMSFEEFSELSTLRDLALDEYADTQIHYFTARDREKAHFNYCLARKKAEKKNLLYGLALIETAEGAELSLASPLELLANSLPSHAPPSSSTAMNYWQVPLRE